MTVGQEILEAARKQAEGEIAVHKTNIKVYQIYFCSFCCLQNCENDI